MKVVWHRRFKKHFVLLPQKIKDKTMETISVFLQDPRTPILRNHALSGEYLGYRSIDITGDWRIVFRQVTSGVYEIVELVDIGTHSQLY